MAQGVNHKREATDVAELAGGVQHARLDVELVQNFIEIVVGHLFLALVQRGQDHGFNGVDTHHLFKQHGRYIDHEIDLAFGKKCHALIVDSRRDQGFAFQIGRATHGFDFRKGTHNHMRLFHHAGNAFVFEGR